MAPTDYDFNLTRNELIHGAFQLIGVLAPGQPLDGTKLVQGVENLNLLVKSWQTKGVFLWKTIKGSINLTAGNASYTLPNDVMAIDSAWYEDSGNNEQQLQIIGWDTYNDITKKDDETNSPLYLATDFSAYIKTMYIWPVPNDTIPLKYQYTQRLKDLDAASDEPDVPQHWLKALKYGLAADLADSYRKRLDERNFLEGKARQLFAEAKTTNSVWEDEYYVSPAYSYRR